MEKTNRPFSQATEHDWRNGSVAVFIFLWVIPEASCFL
jgi:hypothetical protein